MYLRCIRCESGFANCCDLEEVHSSGFQARRADISNAGGVSHRSVRIKKLRPRGPTHLRSCRTFRFWVMTLQQSGASRSLHDPHFSCPQSARPTGANVLRLVARQRKKAPLPAPPAGVEVSFTSIPAGQAGTGIACFTPFWLIEKRIRLRGKHAGVFNSG